MRPGIPWSVKGVEPEVREAAKFAARRAGMTLGEWLNSVILDQNEQDASGPPDQSTHSRENDVPSFSQSPDPSPSEPSPPEPSRPEASRTPDWSDDSARRLQDIAQQLADLAQRERQSTPMPPLNRAGNPAQAWAAEREEFERVVERIDDHERQTIEALTAVNDRLTMLAHQLAGLPRTQSFGKPEDVPGYTALESAIRNVIEHIEVSENRTRDSLKTMQDRLTDIAERSALPVSGEDILRAAPVLSALDSRLADMLNRVQRSENLLSERIEGVKSFSQQLANQAQSSAVTAARGELTEIEMRLLAEIRQVQATAGSSAVLGDLARLRSDIASLALRLDEARTLTASDRDVQALRVALEQLSTRVAQGPDMRPLADMDRRLSDISRHIEQRIDVVSERVGRAEGHISQIGTMEQAIRQLQDAVEHIRTSAGRAAEEAANRAVERLQPQPFVPSPELTALEDGLRAIRDSATAAERRNQETFESIHRTLADVVSKLARHEAQHPSATPASGGEHPSAKSPLAGGDDFIAAARRAAQAAASRPAAPAAEPPKMMASPSDRRFLRRGRKTLIVAGLVLLLAASVYAVRSFNRPPPPQNQSSLLGSPAAPATPSLANAAGPVLTGALPPEVGPKALRANALKGDARAQFVIAGHYLEGQGVPEDAKKAFSWYQQSAASGFAPAQYRLATLFELGKGVRKDTALALFWYGKAAEGGNVKAMHNAAVIAAGGQGGVADYARAYRWFKAAAERGFGDSQFNLGILCERGLGTDANTAEAYFWYSLAAKQGDAAAGQRAADLAKSLPAELLTAATARLAAWAPLVPDENANAVTIADSAWDDV